MQSDSVQVKSEVTNTIPLKLAQEVLVLSKDAMFQTIQGEGPRIGRPTTFMRLGGCNLKCSWCDTKYTWDWTQFDPHTELVPTPIHELADRIMSSRITSLTITGGEPFQQAKNLQKLFRSLLAQHYILDEINFETNGTIFPEWVEDTWGVASNWGIVISPKLANSGKSNSFLEGTVGDVSARTYTLIRWLMQEEYLDGVGGRPLVEVDFKFVCQSSQDFVQVDHIRGIVLETGHPMLAQNVWVMPEGTNPTELTERARSMVDEVISRGWNLTPRWHQDLWSNARAH